MNYFELFSIPVSFLVDKEELSAKYFELQKKYHPDFYTNEDEVQRAEVLEMSSQVNKGFKTLQQPEETIKYILKLKGLLEEEEKYELPPDFLMEMMELNEGLMDTDDSSFQETEVKISQFENSLYAPVRMIIEGYDENVTTSSQLLLVKDYYYKKKYLRRILERMEGMRNIAG